MDIEVSCMQMILHSGNARADAYEAIDNVKNKEFDKSKELIENAKKELLFSQKTHAELLREMASEEDVPTNLLLVHAEDHVSVSEMAIDMAKELYAVYEILAGRKEY
jgi:PTS system cellobiose-specific IIA component